MTKRIPARARIIGRFATAAALAVGCAMAAPIATAQPAPAAPARAPAQRPDIVLFVADDLSLEDVGAYGSRDARTPNMDAMAREGLRFNQAFAPSPTCAVSRSSILTGDYPIRHGAHANHSAVRNGIKTLPSYLAAQGYRVVIAGKTDFGERANFPFEYFPESVIGKGLNARLNTAAIDELLARRDRSKPIALVVASFASHVPWPDNRGFAADRLTLAPYLLDTPETRVARTRYLTKVAVADTELGAVRRSIAEHGDPNNTLLLFTADQGAQFPFAKWNLYDAGIATPLLAVWPGKVAAGRSTDALVSLVDLLPTMEEVAGGPAPADIDGKSMLAVLLGRSNRLHDAIFAAHTGDATNIAPSRTIRTDRYKLIVNYRPDITVTNAISQNTQKRDNAYWLSWVERAKTDPKAAAVVQRFHHRPAVELYDLKSDPHELRNLADDARFDGVEKDLRTRMEAWMVSQGERLDRIPLPRDATRGHYPYAQ